MWSRRGHPWRCVSFTGPLLERVAAWVPVSTLGAPHRGYTAHYPASPFGQQHQRVDVAGTQQPGETFHTRQVQVVYQVGRVFVSGNPPPSSSFAVDDEIRIFVLRPDGTTVSTIKQFPTVCGEVIVPQPPLDITSLFQPGLNTVTVELFDVCGVLERTLNAPLWLANTIP